MVRIRAVIASIGHADETVFPLMEQLLWEGIEVVLVDNRGTFPVDELDDDVMYAEAPGKNVHQAWNVGLDMAAREGADWCCVLNDDIVLEPNAPHRVAELCKDPDIWIAGFDYERHKRVRLRAAEGSYRLHGVGGFAFMVRGASGLRYDERFTWWGGDDDLVWTCIQRGKRAVVVEGVHVQHPHGGGTSSTHYPELMGGLGADRELLLEKWGKAW